MTTKKGVWNLQQVRDKQLQSLWVYQEPATMWSWGTNNYGQVGANSSIEISSPVQIGALTTWKFINGAAGGGGGCFAINESDELFAWGNNAAGQLGQNSQIKYSSPVQIGSGTDWNVISNSYGEAVGAIKTDGTLWTWGNNSYAALGQNNRTQRSSPIQIPGTTWSSISGALMSWTSFISTKTDGTLWGWGSGSYGVLAQNSFVSYSSPIQIGSSTDWANGQDKLAAGRLFCSAIKTDGTLWSWGYNNHGQLGLGNKTNYSSPVQVPGTTWSSVSAIRDSGIARKTDGTIWAWGYNDKGELGQNSRTYYSSPIQIPGTNWKNIQIQGGWNAGFTAIKTDGSLWTWGLNEQGGLGINIGPGAGHRSSPVQIPGTWTKSTGKVYGAIAFQQA